MHAGICYDRQWAEDDGEGLAPSRPRLDVSEALQRAGSAVQVALRTAPDRVSSLAVSLVQRLKVRSPPGDEEPAQHLLATVRREPPPGTAPAR